MKRRSSVQHNYSVMNKLLLQISTQVHDSQSNILATWHVTNKLSKLLLISKPVSHSYFRNSWTREWWYRKVICIVVFCILTICNLANGYQQLGGISSSCLWNIAMHLQYRKLICIVVFCIMTIRNLANGYQQLGGMSSSCLWNAGMHLPKYMAPHHQAHSKTMNKVGISVSSGGAYTVCMYIYICI
jgi:hypothetical protein